VEGNGTIGRGKDRKSQISCEVDAWRRVRERNLVRRTETRVSSHGKTYGSRRGKNRKELEGLAANRWFRKRRKRGRNTCSRARRSDMQLEPWGGERCRTKSARLHEISWRGRKMGTGRQIILEQLRRSITLRKNRAMGKRETEHRQKFEIDQ